MANNVAFAKRGYKFENTEATVEKGIAVEPYGALIIPKSFLEGDTTSVELTLTAEGLSLKNTVDLASLEVGSTIVFQPAV